MYVYVHVSPSYLIIVAVFIISSNNYSYKGRGVFARKKYPMQELLLKMGGGRIRGILRYVQPHETSYTGTTCTFNNQKGMPEYSVYMGYLT